MSEEPSKLDRTKRAFTNNRLFVIMAIVSIGIIGIAGVIKALADVKESAEVLLPATEEMDVVTTQKEREEYLITATVIDENEQALKNVKARLVGQEGLREVTDNNGVFYLRAQRKPGNIAKLRLQADGYEVHEEQWELGKDVRIDLGFIALKEIVEATKIPARTPAASEEKTTINGGQFNGQNFIGNDEVKVINNFNDSLKIW